MRLARSCDQRSARSLVLKNWARHTLQQGTVSNLASNLGLIVVAVKMTSNATPALFTDATSISLNCWIVLEMCFLIIQSCYGSLNDYISDCSTRVRLSYMGDAVPLRVLLLAGWPPTWHDTTPSSVRDSYI